MLVLCGGERRLIICRHKFRILLETAKASNFRGGGTDPRLLVEKASVQF